MRKLLFVLPVLALSVGGCIAKTAVDVVTLPVKAVGKGVDWATTSQDESDRNYGRKMRKAEAREGKERREWDKRCRKDPDCGPYDGYVAARDTSLR
ncbi:hypothetical protein M9980_00105 [Sphingomonas donggukensis]|uniref:Lipoprotein n=1 Tax=Sphingomonas donggukensis TaxID=2949093 RepID=A0ABY4TTM3_9SPHN|nr:hypothetical protein [Sphingomonas donggukensis]URW75678.1 hypothetical protein M9980_00105 [Sphingomonas donggukensis]